MVGAVKGRFVPFSLSSQSCAVSPRNSILSVVEVAPLWMFVTEFVLVVYEYNGLSMWLSTPNRLSSETSCTS